MPIEIEHFALWAFDYVGAALALTFLWAVLLLDVAAVAWLIATSPKGNDDL